MPRTAIVFVLCSSSEIPRASLMRLSRQSAIGVAPSSANERRTLPDVSHESEFAGICHACGALFLLTMKIKAAAALAFLLVAAGVSAETTQRYLIATTTPYHPGTIAAIVRESRQGLSPRDVAGFQSFDGFA